MQNSAASHLAGTGVGWAGRFRAYDSREFQREVVLEKKHHWQMLGGLRYAAQAFCLQPEIAGLQMCARFCLVYHGYCCAENFVLLLNSHSPPHMHHHNAHTRRAWRKMQSLLG